MHGGTLLGADLVFTYVVFLMDELMYIAMPICVMLRLFLNVSVHYNTSTFSKQVL